MIIIQVIKVLGNPYISLIWGIFVWPASSHDCTNQHNNHNYDGQCNNSGSICRDLGHVCNRLWGRFNFSFR